MNDKDSEKLLRKGYNRIKNYSELTTLLSKVQRKFNNFRLTHEKENIFRGLFIEQWKPFDKPLWAIEISYNRQIVPEITNMNTTSRTEFWE